MKRLLLRFVIPFAAMTPIAAQGPPPQEPPELLPLPTGEKLFTWQGHTGRSYFLQVSDPISHLEKWFWAPVIEGGADAEISYEVDSTADKGFFRIHHTDQVPGAGETLDTADFDGDGLANISEINPPVGFQTNPLNPDTDGDGLSDGWERTHGLNPNDSAGANGAGGDPDHDSLTNQEEQALGTDPNNSDSDGDGITDGGEIDQNTDPNDSGDTPDAEWVILTGDLEVDVEKSHSRTVTIPAGESRLLVVALASEEYPEWTATSSEFNDILEWDIRPSSKDDLTGSIDVNSRHDDWDLALIDGTEIQGFSPAHIEKAKTLTAPADTPLSIEIDLSATNVGDGILPSTVMVGLLPVEVSWKAIDGFENVDDHIDPWDNNEIAGNRIFPGYKNPDDTEIRHKLELIVKTSASLAGKSIFVKAFDVDDSTSEVFDVNSLGDPGVIDTNGQAGDDNMADYLDTPTEGQFWTGSAWGGQTAEDTIDEDGEVKFVFRVGMQPGSNYRVVASALDETLYADIQTSDPASPGYLGPETNQNGGAAASPLLTVWRKLWIENDSMEAIPIDQYGYKRNDLASESETPTILSVFYNSTASNTEFSLDDLTDYSSFPLIENGKIIVQSMSHDIVGSGFIGALSIPVAIVDGDHSTVPVSSGYRLYDDDDFGLTEPPLPRLDMVDETFKEAYRSSFIEAVDAKDYNPRKLIPFKTNYAIILGSQSNPQEGIWDDMIDLAGQNKIWIATLNVGYQGDPSEDDDPNSENESEGGTPAYHAKYSVVYVETIRDVLDPLYRNPSQNISDLNLEVKRNISLTAAHEIGHWPSFHLGASHHDEGMLMGASGYVEGLEFSAASVLRFRGTDKWKSY